MGGGQARITVFKMGKSNRINYLGPEMPIVFIAWRIS